MVQCLLPTGEYVFQVLDAGIPNRIIALARVSDAQ